MQKETLTVSAIRQDLYRRARHSLVEGIVSLLCCALLIWLFTVVRAAALPFYDIVLLALALPFAALTVLAAARVTVSLTTARASTVTRDSVAELYTVTQYGWRYPARERTFYVRGLHCRYCIRFKRYGVYRIPLYKQYRWSALFPLTDSGVYNYAHVDDDFYVVLAGKRVLMAYPADLFTFSQDI